jgi:hypothetical protein
MADDAEKLRQVAVRCLRADTLSHWQNYMEKHEHLFQSSDTDSNSSNGEHKLG